MKSRILVGVLLWVLSSSGLLGQQAIDFSGHYSLISLKGDNVPQKVPQASVTVVQRNDTLELISTAQGVSFSRHYTLDGKESHNLSSRGLQTTDRAEIKGTILTIRSLMPLTPDAPPVMVTGRWELSKDLKRLTIQTTVRSTGKSAGTPRLDSSQTETYAREP